MDYRMSCWHDQAGGPVKQSRNTWSSVGLWVMDAQTVFLNYNQKKPVQPSDGLEQPRVWMRKVLGGIPRGGNQPTSR